MKQEKKNGLLQGSLDLMVLHTLREGAQHGYGIARSIKAASQEYLQVEEGSLYPALHRLELKGWIASYWGASDANRRARFYQLTSLGKKQLKFETAAWEQMTNAVNMVLGTQS